jgi:hypothetical protein
VYWERLCCVDLLSAAWKKHAFHLARHASDFQVLWSHVLVLLEGECVM